MERRQAPFSRFWVEVLDELLDGAPWAVPPVDLAAGESVGFDSISSTEEPDELELLLFGEGGVT
jgi:hypothetical protein